MVLGHVAWVQLLVMDFRCFWKPQKIPSKLNILRGLVVLPLYLHRTFQDNFRTRHSAQYYLLNCLFVIYISQTSRTCTTVMRFCSIKGPFLCGHSCVLLTVNGGIINGEHKREKVNAYYIGDESTTKFKNSFCCSLRPSMLSSAVASRKLSHMLNTCCQS